MRTQSGNQGEWTKSPDEMEIQQTPAVCGVQALDQTDNHKNLNSKKSNKEGKA